RPCDREHLGAVHARGGAASREGMALAVLRRLSDHAREHLLAIVSGRALANGHYRGDRRRFGMADGDDVCVSGDGRGGWWNRVILKRSPFVIPRSEATRDLLCVPRCS